MHVIKHQTISVDVYLPEENCVTNMNELTEPVV